jgi:hypothetical protein
MMNAKEFKMSQIKMYGMTVDQIREDYMMGITARLAGHEMVVMSILSDIQHVIGSNETARQQLNVAKFILSEMMAEKRNKEAV